MKDNTPSNTALIVAILLILAGAANEKLVPPEAVQAQVKLLKNVKRRLPRLPSFWVIANPLFARFVRFLVNFIVLPNLLDGIGFRKIFMEKSVRAMLANSRNAQVLIVAAGYDTLAYRLAKELPSTQFWEVDHPATGHVKREAIHKMGPSVPDNLNLVAADLTKTKLQTVLSQEPGYDTSKPTIVILEGLLFYLEEVHVRELFSDLAHVVGADSQVALDHFSEDKAGNIDNGPMTSIQSFMVTKMGERWHWAIHPSELESFFQDTSWCVKEQMPRVGVENCVLLELSG